MDAVSPSNWHNQHSEPSANDSTEDEDMDAPMDEDSPLFFIPNANDTHSN